MKVAVIFHRFGPYHSARLGAAARRCDLTAVELAAETGEYDWAKVHGAAGYARLTLFPEGDSRAASAGEIQKRVSQALNECHPDAVAIPGWSDPGAFAALLWCSETRTPAIGMSESTAHDEPRVLWKEFVKRRIVGLYSTALVGGRLHAAYLEQLGMAPERIFTGYDVVDNEHFAGRGRSEVRGQRSEVRGEGLEVRDQRSEVRGLSSAVPFFLASARFIEKKNLFTLVRAYAGYEAEGRRQKEEGRSQRSEVGGQRSEVGGQRSEVGGQRSEVGGQRSEVGGQRSEVGGQRLEGRGQGSVSILNSPLSATTGTPWKLVLLGDGPLKSELCHLISDLSLEGSVLLPGFKQYDELPAYYAQAGAFVHASTTEQWGLVVNEAIAAGLPVIVSNRCGCAPELVCEGVNGFTFDPNDAKELTKLLVKMSSLPAGERERFRSASREIAGQHQPERFGNGLVQAAELALKLPRRNAGTFDRLLLNRLLHR